MNKNFLILPLIIFLFVATNTFVVAKQSSGANNNQVGQQTQNNNQGENSQTQIQNNENQNNYNNEEQSQNGDGEEIQNQNQINNQGKDNQIKNKEQEEVQAQNKTGMVNAQERRSQVANAVQEMLQVAERNQGIGEQVRTIAQAQNQNQEKIEESLVKIQNRNQLVRFIIGPNYSEINSAKKLLEQNQEQANQLNQIKNQLINQADQEVLMEQIQTLNQASLEIENSLNNSQKSFSLLGWMFKMFIR